MALPSLVPVSTFKLGFTTCASLSHSKIECVDLNDKKLGVHKVASSTSHKIVKGPVLKSPCPPLEFPAPTNVWEAVYPKGSYKPSGPIPGGFSFYVGGPTAFSEGLKTATEVVMSYRMMLQEGWQWVKGGKLPGVFGGIGDLAYGCSGGRQESRCQCFDLRPMWRGGGDGELYTYLPLSESNKNRLLAVPPRTIENSDYGFSVGRGSFCWDIAAGRWVSVAFRVKLNDIGFQNGEVQLWIDGVSAMNIDGLELRYSKDSTLKGFHFQTFFGGSTAEWASPKEQKAWFADLTGVIIK
ncbi:hypothetical protein BDQ12DRAFT_707183 [Crucibulum laeve]|uniref:Polysaccharide lyase 14 domain-containing protein n=1 Tax=Crucibulum laeve TaxID=68775 RepID=A0A5C3LN86_9AGAR|nr:hypothetical protein BDQ12DRAFT_707183 [Crucibulum laeve]